LNYVGADTALEKPRHLPAELAQAAAADISAQALEEIPDDRAELTPGEPSLLVVEDDPRYASVLRDHARSQGFKVLVANRGSEALRLPRGDKARESLALHLHSRLPGA